MSEPIQTTELIQETAQAVEATGGLGMLGINLKIFLAQLANFLVVLFVLWKWVYQPMVKMLDARTQRIETSMKHAEEIETKMLTIEDDQKKLLQQTKTEAAKILEQSREDAERRKQEQLDVAKQEVQRVIAQGKEQLRSEKTQMLREAKEEMIEIAVAAARKILEEGVDEKKSQKIAEQTVDQLS